MLLEYCIASCIIIVAVDVIAADDAHSSLHPLCLSHSLLRLLLVAGEDFLSFSALSVHLLLLKLQLSLETHTHITTSHHICMTFTLAYLHICYVIALTCSIIH